MRLRVVSIAVCTCALLLGAAAAGPKAAGLQYDQIVRIIVAPATPPPPGSFAQAYQALIAAEQAQSPAPAAAPKRHGLAGLIQSVGNAQAQVQQAANDMQTVMQYGTLMRVASYNGWTRTDDVVHNTAVIDKCREHQTIYLDLAKKTYRIVSAQPNVEPCPAPQMPQNEQEEGATQAPGTGDVTLTASRQNLGRMIIDGVPADGSVRTIQMSMTNATGSCKNGSFTIQTTQYVSSIAIPRRYCPLPKIRNVPTTPADVVQRAGCKPRYTAGSKTGASFAPDADRLELYARMTMMSGENAGKFNTVTQAGNIKWLSKAQADALFSIPPGFTPQT